MSLGENSLVAAYQGKGQLKSRPSGIRVLTLVITEASAATGNSIPLQSSFFDCSINLLVILWGLLSVGFNALVIHHLKHSLSSFFILIIAFLLASSTGNEMYELPFNGL